MSGRPGLRVTCATSQGQSPPGTGSRLRSSPGSVHKVHKLWSQSTGVLQVSVWVRFPPSPQSVFPEIWKTRHRNRVELVSGWVPPPKVPARSARRHVPQAPQKRRPLGGGPGTPPRASERGGAARGRARSDLPGGSLSFLTARPRAEQPRLRGRTPESPDCLSLRETRRKPCAFSSLFGWSASSGPGSWRSTAGAETGTSHAGKAALAWVTRAPRSGTHLSQAPSTPPSRQRPAWTSSSRGASEGRSRAGAGSLGAGGAPTPGPRAVLARGSAGACQDCPCGSHVVRDPAHTSRVSAPSPPTNTALRVAAVTRVSGGRRCGQNSLEEPLNHGLFHCGAGPGRTAGTHGLASGRTRTLQVPGLCPLSEPPTATTKAPT